MEIGSEPTPAEFLDVLLALTAEWGRVLAPWGSIAIELGDSYTGVRKALRPRTNRPRIAKPGEGPMKWDRDDGRRYVTGQPYADNFRLGNPGGAGWPRPKSLALIPQLYAVALAYGLNPLTGAESPAGKWLVRNVIVWHRPNPAPSDLGDKVRPSTSYITVATRAAKRWFDLDAVRHPGDSHQTSRSKLNLGNPGYNTGAHTGSEVLGNPAGAPPLDCWFDEHDEIDLGEFTDDSHETWSMPTESSTLAHYAMWPSKLAERLILMMCPAEVCTVCGEPRRRINGAPTLEAYRGSDRAQTRRAVALADKNGLTDAHIAAIRAFGTSDAGKAQTINNGAGKNTADVTRLAGEAKAVLGGYFREFVMSGNCERPSTWSDCGHGAFGAGTVLDPFAGTGTTLAVADLLGRNGIGFDLNPASVALYPRRRIECERALFATRRQMAGQLDIFGEEVPG